jgi:hypothetical protein
MVVFYYIEYMKMALLVLFLVVLGCRKESVHFVQAKSVGVWEDRLDIYIDSMNAGYGNFYRLPNGDTLFVIGDS